MHNPYNDKFFIARIRDGMLVVFRDGTVYNMKTARLIGATGTGRYPKISMYDSIKKVWSSGRKCIRNMLIHRLVWLSYRGPIPAGFEINHIDGNKQNPSLINLELITHTKNMEHAVVNNLLTIRRGDAQKYAVFKDEDVPRLRLAVSSGEESVLSIARRYDCHRVTVYYMLKGKSYAHLPGQLVVVPRSRLGQKPSERKLFFAFHLKKRGVLENKIAKTLNVSIATVKRYAGAYDSSKYMKHLAVLRGSTDPRMTKLLSMR